MKPVVMKTLKTLLIFSVSTITIYMVFTIGYFFSWCNDKQINLFVNDIASEIPNLDKEKVQELGDYVGDYAQLLEDSIEEQNNEESGSYIIAEHFDPLGFSVWSYLREVIIEILDRYDTISIFLGLATTIAYTTVTSKKVNNILKFVIGYLVPMLIIPPMYTYFWTFRFWNIYEMYSRGIPKVFYIVYTAIFLLIFIINYIVGIRMASALNKTIEKGGDYYEQDK